MSLFQEEEGTNSPNQQDETNRGNKEQTVGVTIAFRQSIASIPEFFSSGRELAAATNLDVAIPAGLACPPGVFDVCLCHTGKPNGNKKHENSQWRYALPRAIPVSRHTPFLPDLSGMGNRKPEMDAACQVSIFSIFALIATIKMLRDINSVPAVGIRRIPSL